MTELMKTLGHEHGVDVKVKYETVTETWVASATDVFYANDVTVTDSHNEPEDALQQLKDKLGEQ